jgi:Tol biopolymer transport system component
LGSGRICPRSCKSISPSAVQNLGYSPTLYQVAFRSPETGVSVVSFEDVSTDQGWDLVLADDKGRLLKDLQARKQDDILPAWQPDGKSLAYLAEVEAKEKKP